jgi:hypothetical protein
MRFCADSPWERWFLTGATCLLQSQQRRVPHSSPEEWGTPVNCVGRPKIVRSLSELVVRLVKENAGGRWDNSVVIFGTGLGAVKRAGTDLITAGRAGGRVLRTAGRWPAPYTEPRQRTSDRGEAPVVRGLGNLGSNRGGQGEQAGCPAVGFGAVAGVLGGKAIRRVIVVKGRLVNLII